MYISFVNPNSQISCIFLLLINRGFQLYNVKLSLQKAVKNHRIVRRRGSHIF
jgi:hypothetical protein